MNRKNFVDYTKLDQKLFEIAGALETNLIKYINPQNLQEEKNKFFYALEKNEEYNPNFNYNPRMFNYSYFAMNPRLNTFKTELTETLKEIERDDLGIIFESEIIDLLEKIELIRSIGTENFSGNSESYYGGIEKKQIHLAKNIIQAQTNTEKEEQISFDSATQIIKNFLKNKRIHYKIKIREPSGARFAVINSQREILINKNTIFTKEMLQRLIAHEIETHIYRYENGSNQPYKILAHGFSRETTETEEGLAVNMEKLKGVSSQKQIKEYAGRLLAISQAEKKSFFQTYLELNKYFNQEDSFRLTLRAKRGIINQKNQGAFYKDASYFKGMLRVEDFLKKHSIKELYYGKYALEDTPLIRTIPGLREPKYLPEINKTK